MLENLFARYESYCTQKYKRYTLRAEKQTLCSTSKSSGTFYPPTIVEFFHESRTAQYTLDIRAYGYSFRAVRNTFRFAVSRRSLRHHDHRQRISYSPKKIPRIRTIFSALHLLTPLFPPTSCVPVHELPYYANVRGETAWTWL